MHRQFYPIKKPKLSLYKEVRSHWPVARNVNCSHFPPELIYKHYKLLSLTTFHFKTLENKWCSGPNYFQII